MAGGVVVGVTVCVAVAASMVGKWVSTDMQSFPSVFTSLWSLRISSQGAQRESAILVEWSSMLTKVSAPKGKEMLHVLSWGDLNWGVAGGGWLWVHALLAPRWLEFFFFSGEQGEFGQVYSFHNGEWAMYNTCYRIISGFCNVPRQMWHSLHMSKESHRTSEGGSLEWFGRCWNSLENNAQRKLCMEYWRRKTKKALVHKETSKDVWM